MLPVLETRCVLKSREMAKLIDFVRLILQLEKMSEAESWHRAVISCVKAELRQKFKLQELLATPI